MQIAKTTENAVLRKQIEERVAWDLNSIKMLKMNQGGFFYALDVFDAWDNEYENEGYYTTFEMSKLNAIYSSNLNNFFIIIPSIRLFPFFFFFSDF